MNDTRNVLVTGAAGFIGSSLVRSILNQTDWHIAGFDALTYAGRRENLAEIDDNDRFSFVHANICDPTAVAEAFRTHKPDLVFHLAAESHVDRSIDSAADFIRTNVLGTQILLDEVRRYAGRSTDFRFVHISTDEVFGDLLPDDPPFSEKSSYKPSSPYAASKAASDHLVRAAHRTHKLPVLISNCSNNYGPRQFPEKLIPLTILNICAGLPITIYGDGRNRRDWLHVEDHADALIRIASLGELGETYCVGGGHEVSNLEIVKALHTEMVAMGVAPVTVFEQAIEFVTDRPGHDWRYAIDPQKIQSQLGWTAARDIKAGLRATIEWYIANEDWWQKIRSSTYQGERLGLGAKS